MGLSLLEFCLIPLSFCFKPSIQKSLLHSVHTHSIFPIFKIGFHPGFPAGSDGKESCLQSWGPRLNPRVQKSPWSRE